MKKLIEILNKSDCEWKVNVLCRQSYELFFVHSKVETSRATDTVTKSVTVYVRHDGKEGDCTFNVYSSDTEAEIYDKIALAKSQAALAFNEPYALPTGEQCEKTVESNFSDWSLPVLGEKIAEACFKADSYQNGSINALEIFVYKDTVSVVNSNGLDKTEHKFRAMVEAIPTWNENGDSVELYEAYWFTALDEAALTAEIDSRMREVRDRYHATKPNQQICAPVVLNSKEIASLCDEICYQLNYAAVYSKQNIFGKGDDFQHVAQGGDGLNITMCRSVKGSRASAVFDDDGVTLCDTEIIKNGVAVGLYGGNRFGQYLGEKITGNLPCVKLGVGTLTSDDLAKTEYFECVSMSGLQVDLYNDYIGGEVRLGYLHRNGEKIPVTGVSISGKLSEVLPTLRLSETAKLCDWFFGPGKLLLCNVNIL